MINVVAGLIWQAGKLLICKRPKSKSLPLLWEFPGGKVEEGETKFQALKREIKEELGVIIETREIYGNTVFQYDDFSVNITFINSIVVGGIPDCLEHEEIRWVNISELDQFEFCPADVEILTEIMTKKQLDKEVVPGI